MQITMKTNLKSKLELVLIWLFIPICFSLTIEEVELMKSTTNGKLLQLVKVKESTSDLQDEEKK